MKKHLIHWVVPAALIILLIAVTRISNAEPDRFWSAKVDTSGATYSKTDGLTQLRIYLESEEILYVVREEKPQALTIYYDYGEENRTVITKWTCRKLNASFPGIYLRSFVTVDINDISRGKTDLDCG